jgi:hypothetical protein
MYIKIERDRNAVNQCFPLAIGIVGEDTNRQNLLNVAATKVAKIQLYL